MTMSKSEAGKLGWLAAKDIQAKNRLQSLTAKIQTYMGSPAHCGHCNVSLEYKNRKNKFCSQSCAASFNNAAFPKKRSRIKHTCLGCEKDTYSKYCSNLCQRQHEFAERTNDWLLTGKASGRIIKPYLIKMFGYKCSECGIAEYNAKPITLELEHKDGNSENNLVENLCLLCPNCHSQTPTYRNKNRGNGRHSRRVRYAEGKSY